MSIPESEIQKIINENTAVKNSNKKVSIHQILLYIFILLLIITTWLTIYSYNQVAKPMHWTTNKNPLEVIRENYREFIKK